MSICLATSREIPRLTADDGRLRDGLVEAGWQVDIGVWSDPTVPWESYRAVIVRSCWDYHLRIVEFRQWLDSCERLGVRLWNPVASIRWNLHKAYLVELERYGIPVVSTRIVRQADRRDLGELLEAQGWDDAVVKPAIGASAYGTFRTSRRTAPSDRARFESLSSESDLLVQPLVEEVEAIGELSFVFFRGRYSHTVRKCAPPGEFRVQKEFGGSVVPYEPTANQRAQASRIAAALPVDWLFARIDAVEVGGELRIMEVELIEPELFFRHREESPAALAAALAGRLHEAS